MTTRAQVLMKDTGVYLYQHCDGYDLINTVTSAIARNGRLDDVEHLTRIIFSEMIRDYIDGSTGYGIGVIEHCDIEYLVTVDCEEQTVTEFEMRGDKRRTLTFEDIIFGKSFEER